MFKTRTRKAVLGCVTIMLTALAGSSLFVGASYAQDFVLLELSPRTATNAVGTQHCVTATVRRLTGPVSGAWVHFRVFGTSIEAVKTTEANGNATFCYMGPSVPRTDTITATLGPSAIPYLVNPPSCDDQTGLAHSLHFVYTNDEALTLNPAVGCTSESGTDSDQTASGLSQSATVSQTTATASDPTAVTVSTSLSNPGAIQPTPTKTIDLRLPTGMVRNSSTVPTCSLTTLETDGPAGCDSGSIVGFGTMTTYAKPVITDPIQAQLTAFNGENGNVLLFVFPDLGPTFIIRGQPLADETISFDVPEILTLPSAPPAAIEDLTLTLGQSEPGVVSSDWVTNTWVAASGGGGSSGGGSGGQGVGTIHVPRIKLGGSRNQRFKGSVVVSTGCDVPCTVSASATVSVAGASKLYRSERVTRKLAAGRSTKVRLRFAKKAARAIRRALSHGKRLKAHVRLQAHRVGASASKSSSGTLTIELRR